MIASLALVLALCLGFAVWLALKAARRTLAGELVGEICEILEAIDAHDTERALAAFREGRSSAPALPPPPSLAFASNAVLMPVLGPHVGRLAVSFYASAAMLFDELRALSARAPSDADNGGCAAARLKHTIELGDETLRALRGVMSNRRRNLIARA